MRKSFWILWVFVLLTLTACGAFGDSMPGDATDPAPTETLSENTPQPVVEIKPQVETETPGEDLALQDPTEGPTSECTLVSSLPEPSQEYAELFAVTKDDWIIGPEDAAVTLVEYGDFQ